MKTKSYKSHSIFIKENSCLFKTVDEYAFLCKNLKNSVLYHYRQTFFNENKTPNKFDVVNKFCREKQSDYVKLPSRIAQHTIFQVAQEFQSFWGLLKAYSKDKSKQRPNIPRYLDKTKGRANVIFTKTAISKVDLTKGILTLSPFDKSKKISIPLGNLVNKIDLNSIQEVRLIKVPNGYECKIVYLNDNVSQLKENNDRYFSVDFGINNLMTVGNNIGLTPFIIKGKALKSFNQYFNKQKAKLQSKLDLAKNEQIKKGIQRKLNRLSRKRKFKVNDFLHKASRCLINHVVSNNANTIVIGYNKGWKQEINIGKSNNQKFVSIPFYKLLEMIKYKALEKGINVVVTEESYTSKCSFLDSEPLTKQTSYKGSRVKRGLFKSSNSILLNADVNGALNILRKVIGDFKFDPIQVCSTPKTFNVLKH